MIVWQERMRMNVNELNILKIFNSTFRKEKTYLENILKLYLPCCPSVKSNEDIKSMIPRGKKNHVS